MISLDTWRVAARIAWREASASSGKFLFVILAVAVGVGALTGVRGFSQAFQNMLLRDARTLLAADLSIRVFHQLTPEEAELFEQLEQRGVERTWITETISAMSSEDVSRPLLIAVKAVERDRYPFYGTIELEPPGSLRQVLADDVILASEDLLLRLDLDVGDRVRLGDTDFRIAAQIKVEPDRMTGSLNVGPRIMISRGGLDRSGLIQPGSRAVQRYLLRVGPETPSIAEVRQEVETVFAGARVVDFREAHPVIQRGLNRATNFLSLVSLIALMVGSLGVAMAIHTHLQQRLDTIAIMKCVGGRSSQIIRIYLLQTLGLGVAGSLAGVAVGLLVQAWFPSWLPRYFPSFPAVEWQPVVALQGIAVGISATLLFTLAPLLGIRRIRPALIFRRDMESSEPRQRSRAKIANLTLGGVAVLAVGLAAAWLGDSVRLGIWFAAGLLVSLAVLAAFAWMLLRLLRALPRLLRGTLPSWLRHGIANLHRPGAHAGAVLIALGIGVTFTLSVYLLQSSVLEQLVLSAPPDMPNVFFVNVTDQERDGLVKLVKNHPDIEGELDLVASIAGRLVSVDGVSIEQFAQEGPARRYRRTRTITWEEERPEGIEIVRGAWWDAEALRSGEALVSARETAADALDLRLGSELEWQVAGRTVQAKLAAIHRAEEVRPGSRVHFILTPNALAGLPTIYYGSARITPDRAPKLQKAVFDRFPSISVIHIGDVVAIIQEVVDQIGIVIRFISTFAIFAGVIILVSSVMATRFRRIHEVAILKTLGATRRRVTSIFSVEFLVLGLAAGLMGSTLATAFSGLLLEHVLDASFRFDPAPHLLSIAGTGLLANVAGWLASFSILGKKPLEVIRNE